MTRECTAAILYMLENSVEVLKVFPDELPNCQVFWNHFVSAIWELVSQFGSFDQDIIDVGDHNFRDFRL
jgi:hypothetical protein